MRAVGEGDGPRLDDAGAEERGAGARVLDVVLEAADVKSRSQARWRSRTAALRVYVYGIEDSHLNLQRNGQRKESLRCGPG
jgi:hypothetical protein